MITCKQCHTENKNGSHFCDQCGARLSKASRKRNRVVGKSRRKTTVWKAPAVFAGIGLLLVVFATMDRSPASNPRILAQPQIVERVEYGNRNISMSVVESTVENGRITIPLQAVSQKQLVRFNYDTDKGKLPLMAYITPSGRLVTAVSVCEPCQSTSFHIEGEEMACNTCDSRWDLETLAGISGGCLAYPPDFIPSTIQGHNIVIDEMIVRQWRPRV